MDLLGQQRFQVFKIRSNTGTVYVDVMVLYYEQFVQQSIHTQVLIMTKCM